MPPISTPSTSSDDDNRSIPAVRTHSSNTFNRRRIALRTGGIKEYITVGNVLAVLLIIPLTFTYIKVMITGPAPSPGSNIHTIYSPVTITSTIYTPSSTAISNRNSHGNSHDPSANPWPNFTYEILASSSRKSLALNSGRVTLAGPRSGKNPGVRVSTHLPSPRFHHLYAELILPDSGNASKLKDGFIFKTPLPVVFLGTISGVT